MSPLFLLVTLLFSEIAFAKMLVPKRPKRNLKVYLYNMTKRFSVETIVHHLENYKDPNWMRSNCGWNTHVCKEQAWHKEYSTFRQYGADVTIIQKFKHYDNLVTDAKDADIFVVPYPHSSDCRSPPHGEIWPSCRGVDWRELKKMVAGLAHYNEKTKFRHLFLLTGDWSNNEIFLEDQPLYTTLGGIPNAYGYHKLPKFVTNIVVPPPVLEPEYQPSALAKTNWTRQRKYSVYMNAGLVTQQRKDVYRILSETSSVGGLPTLKSIIEGHRHMPLPPSKIWENYRNTVFCPVIKGDLPYQKRFYDVILSGCLPVVLASPSWDEKFTGCPSWFDANKPNYVTTHAFARGGRPSRRGMSVDYREFVVQVPGGPKNMIPTLEKIMKDKKKLHAMQHALGRNARKLVYGLDDDMNAEGDAFDQLLGRLRQYLDSGYKTSKIHCS